MTIDLEILNEYDYVIARSCILCTKVFPMAYLNFLPFVKGGICDECRYSTRTRERIEEDYLHARLAQIQEERLLLLQKEMKDKK